MPWQSTYSEWYFPKKLWPAFTKKDLANVEQERDEAEINKMNQNIDTLLERVDKIVNEFKDM